MSNSAVHFNKLLLIEDDELDREHAVNFFASSKIGNEIIFASSAIEGLKKVEDEQPDVVFIDVNLPDGNVLDFFEQIKNVSKIGCAFVLVTGIVDAKTISRAKKLGVNGYVQKPFTRDKLDEVVEKLDDDFWFLGRKRRASDRVDSSADKARS